MSPSKPDDQNHYWANWVVLFIAGLCCVIELSLTLADLDILSWSRARATTYEYAGFWPGLLRDWTPNYSAQPYLMFVTYAFLHGGLVHLVVNMSTLFTVSMGIIDRVGSRGFALLYLGSMLGGGIGYALLANALTPMVGASGALFGLVGGQLAWGYVDTFTRQDSLWWVLRSVMFLIALNLVLWWAMDGHLAWETHLGGFIAGWIFALVIDPTSRDWDDRDAIETDEALKE